MHLTDALVDFVEACAARRPTPGGGAAAALAGALGAALGEMAASFSKAGAKGKAAAGSDPSVIEQGLRDLGRVREALLPLVEADCEAYDRVRAAMALPRESPAEKEERTAQLQDALQGALDVPLRAARLCVEGLEILDRMAPSLNAHLITDAASSVLFLAACYRASWYNVRVNLNSIKNPELATRVSAEGEILAARINELERSVLSQSDAILNR
jgi:formiminotetrahydrofolate cyclodeaminase